MVAMRIQSSLLGWLAKAAPGANKPGNSDALLELPATLINAGRFPFPLLRTVANGSFLPAAEKVVGTIAAYRFDPVGTALALDWIIVPEGVWDMELIHGIVPRGAINDLTADANVLLGVVDNGVSRFSILSRFVPFNNAGQTVRRTMVLTVTKEIQVKLQLSHTIGLGTSLCESFASVVLSKIY
jgi:hypothetical protein